MLERNVVESIISMWTEVLYKQIIINITEKHLEKIQTYGFSATSLSKDIL